MSALMEDNNGGTYGNSEVESITTASFHYRICRICSINWVLTKSDEKCSELTGVCDKCNKTNGLSKTHVKSENISNNNSGNNSSKRSEDEENSKSCETRQINYSEHHVTGNIQQENKYPDECDDNPMLKINNIHDISASLNTNEHFAPDLILCRLDDSFNIRKPCCHQCRVCPKIFQHATALASHEHTHTYRSVEGRMCDEKRMSCEKSSSCEHCLCDMYDTDIKSKDEEISESCETKPITYKEFNVTEKCSELIGVCEKCNKRNSLSKTHVKSENFSENHSSDNSNNMIEDIEDSESCATKPIAYSECHITDNLREEDKYPDEYDDNPMLNENNIHDISATLSTKEHRQFDPALAFNSDVKFRSTGVGELLTVDYNTIKLDEFHVDEKLSAMFLNDKLMLTTDTSPPSELRIVKVESMAGNDNDNESLNTCSQDIISMEETCSNIGIKSLSDISLNKCVKLEQESTSLSTHYIGADVEHISPTICVIEDLFNHHPLSATVSHCTTSVRTTVSQLDDFLLPDLLPCSADASQAVALQYSANWKYVKYLHPYIPQQAVSAGEAASQQTLIADAPQLVTPQTTTTHAVVTHSLVNVSQGKDPYLRLSAPESLAHACSFCFEQFAERREMMAHEQLHRPDPSLTCGLCKERFETDFLVEQHCRLKHRDKLKELYSCSSCLYTTMNLSVFVSHLHWHAGELPYVCTQCEKRYTSRLKLIAHIKTTHHKEREPKVLSKQSIDLTSKVGTLQIDNAFQTTVEQQTSASNPIVNYTASVHQAVSQLTISASQVVPQEMIDSRLQPITPTSIQTQAAIAQQTFSVSEAADTYLQTSLYVPLTHSCSTCRQLFSGSLEMIEHEQLHRPDPREKCGICQETFETELLLQVHCRSNHRDESSGLYTCSWPSCPYAFKDIRTFINHARMHSGDRPYACTLCEYRCVSRERLTRHIRSHQNLLKCNKSLLTQLTAPASKLHQTMSQQTVSATPGVPLSQHTKDHSAQEAARKTAAPLPASLHQDERNVIEVECSLPEQEETDSSSSVDDDPVYDNPDYHHAFETETSIKVQHTDVTIKYFTPDLILCRIDNSFNTRKPCCHQCRECPKIFKYATALARHKHIHTNRLIEEKICDEKRRIWGKKLSCKHCFKKFKLSSGLARHIRLLHRSTKLVKCSNCLINFKDISKHVCLKDYVRRRCVNTRGFDKLLKSEYQSKRHDLGSAFAPLTVSRDEEMNEEIVDSRLEPITTQATSTSATLERQSLSVVVNTEMAGNNIRIKALSDVSLDKCVKLEQKRTSLSAQHTFVDAAVEQCLHITPKICIIRDLNHTVSAPVVHSVHDAASHQNDSGLTSPLECSADASQVVSLQDTANQNLPFPVIAIAQQAVSVAQDVDEHVELQASDTMTHACPICHLRFSCRVEMMKHKQLHRPDVSEKCGICQETCETEFLLQEHYEWKHFDKVRQLFSCTFCVYSCKSVISFVSHVRLHTVTRPYVCTQCGQCLRNVRLLSHHVKYAHPVASQQAVSAPQASAQKTLIARTLQLIKPRTISTLAAVTEELVSVTEAVDHSAPEPLTHACSICCQQFAERREMMDHEQLHRPDPSLTCGLCKERFETDFLVEQHCRLKHRDKLKQLYFCSSCLYTTMGLSFFVSHLRLHAGELPYVCTQCAKRYTSRLGLIAHIKCIHHKERDHKALSKQPIDLIYNAGTPQTSKVLQTSVKQRTIASNSVLHHVASVHQAVSQLTTSAPQAVSQQIVSTREALSQQTVSAPQAVSHPGVSQQAMSASPAASQKTSITRTLQPLTHACSFCHQQFAERRQVTEHAPLHRPDPSGMCSICKEQFETDLLLQHHCRLKHRDRLSQLYSCSLCLYTTLSLGIFVSHVRLHACEIPFVCTQCEKQYMNSPELIAHIKSTQQKEMYHNALSKQPIDLLSKATTPQITGVLQATVGQQTSASNPSVHHTTSVHKAVSQPTVSAHLAVIQQTLSAPQAVLQQTTPASQAVLQQATPASQAVSQQIVSASQAVSQQIVSAPQAVSQQTVSAPLAVSQQTVSATQAVLQLTVSAPQAVSKEMIDYRLQSTSLYTTTMSASLSVSDGAVKHLETSSQGLLTHACSICLQFFAGSREMMEHEQLHRPDPRQKCGICQETFDTELLLWTHCWSVHKDKSSLQDKYTCSFDMCPYATKHLREFVNHARSHRGKKPFACTQCEHRWLIEHIRRSHQNKMNCTKTHSAQPILASKVQETISQQTSLITQHVPLPQHTIVNSAHVTTPSVQVPVALHQYLHNVIEEEYSLPAQTENDSSSTIDSVNENPDDQHPSETSIRVLYADVTLNHFTPDLILCRIDNSFNTSCCHQCRVCPKIFQDPTDLASHKLTHTDKSVEGRICDVKHRGCEKSLSCKHCFKKFKFSSRLARHVRLVHRSAKLVKCSNCLINFGDVSKHVCFKEYVPRRCKNTRLFEKHLSAHQRERHGLESLQKKFAPQAVSQQTDFVPQAVSQMTASSSQTVLKVTALKTAVLLPVTSPQDVLNVIKVKCSLPEQRENDSSSTIDPVNENSDNHHPSETSIKVHYADVPLKYFTPDLILRRIDCALKTTKPCCHRCHQCPKIFQHATALANHEHTHVDRSIEGKICDEKHRGCEKSLSCKYCFIKFKFSSRLARHVRLVHRSAKLVKCSKCLINFGDISKHVCFKEYVPRRCTNTRLFGKHLSAHQQDRHGLESLQKNFAPQAVSQQTVFIPQAVAQQTVPAPQAVSQLTVPAPQTVSQLTVSSSQTVSQEMIDCRLQSTSLHTTSMSASLSISDDAVKHLETSSQERLTHACSICSQFFSGCREQLHRPDPGEKCGICQETFDTESLLYGHCFTAHRDERSQLYTCSVDMCPYATKRISEFVNHARSHSGVKPFACRQCEHRWLIEHIILSHQNKMICTKTKAQPATVASKVQQTISQQTSMVTQSVSLSQHTT